MNTTILDCPHIDLAAAIPRLFRSTQEKPRVSGSKHDAQIDDLHENILAVEQRLGTPAEQSGDLDLARQLAHLLIDKLTIRSLRTEIRAQRLLMTR